MKIEKQKDWVIGILLLICVILFCLWLGAVDKSERIEMETKFKKGLISTAEYGDYLTERKADAEDWGY